MTLTRGLLLSIAALAMLAIMWKAKIDASSDDRRARVTTVTADTRGEDTASIPDFDGDGTIGFGDFVKFAAKFGLGQSDAGYDPLFDLNGDGEIGFSDFVIFAQDFGKEAPSPTVEIADANLRAIIENRLGKASGTSIYEHEMATLTSLDARYIANDRTYVPIRDLQGIQFAANLVELRLSDSAISATSPVDLSPLSSLTNLRLLWLHGINNVEDPKPLDLSPMAGLINLTELDLRANNISYISPLSGLTDLTELNLQRNSITDISPLSGLTDLTYLDLRENKISNVSPLAGLTNLREVLLSVNNISDIAPLTTNTGLGSGDIVDVRTNPLDAASISTHMSALQAKGVRVSFDELFVFTDPQVYNKNVFVLPVSDNLAAGKLPLSVRREKARNFSG